MSALNSHRGCCDLDAVALRFLASEFAGPAYSSRSMDRRVELFLTRRGPRCVLENGTAHEDLIQAVLANLRPARRTGILANVGEATVP
ncbi:hypothetical protein BCA37_16960 [Mycobacterium sp. djl-10]|nr:hypothetical protein BCA37_16960 [Mycobacterium sp. djl-10]